MKKAIALILVSLLCLLCACSSGSRSDSDAADETAVQEDVRIVTFRFGDSSDGADGSRYVYDPDKEGIILEKDGGSEMILPGVCRGVHADSEALYYLGADGSLYCAALDGSESAILREANTENIFLMLRGDKLYYMNSAHDLLEYDVREHTVHSIDGHGTKFAYCTGGKVYFLSKAGNPVIYDPLTDEKTVGDDTLTDVADVCRDGEDFYLVQAKKDAPNGYEIYVITDDSRFEKLEEPYPVTPTLPEDETAEPGAEK